MKPKGTAQMDTIVTCRGLTRVYGKGELAVHALRGVDLDIRKGDFASLAGPSGSGKTTLLNMIGALDLPDAGEIVIDGEPLAGFSKAQLSDLRLRRIGFVFQSLNLIPVLSAQENIEFVLELQGCDKTERRARAAKALADVGLAGMEHRRPAALSGGQQQRIAVARALIANPSIVLADEPTANLDTKTALDLIELMHRLNREVGTTFVIGTHDSRVMEHTTRHIELVDGKIASDTTR